MFASLLLFTPLGFTLASPLSPSATAVDTAAHCGQWDQVTSGPYTLFLNQWGASGATSGSQCAQVMSQSGNNIAWMSNWTWTGGNGVKSYTNVQQNNGVGKTLAQIKSVPSTWSWSYSMSGSVVANVAYDLFTASTPTGNNVNEIMIWLANYNAGPISSAYNSDATPKAAASNLKLAGHTWNLYTGSNGANNVYSFLPTSGTVTSFNGDINTFLQYLTKNQGVSSSQYLKTAQGGTEPTSGKGTLTTSSFSLVIN